MISNPEPHRNRAGGARPPHTPPRAPSSIPRAPSPELNPPRAAPRLNIRSPVDSASDPLPPSVAETPASAAEAKQESVLETEETKQAVAAAAAAAGGVQAMAVTVVRDVETGLDTSTNDRDGDKPSWFTPKSTNSSRIFEQGPPYFGAMGSNTGGASGGFYQPFNSNLAGAGASTGIQNFPGVRLRGLPFDCNDIDICKFFVGLDIVDCLLVNKNGRFTGEAFVVFPTAMQTESGLHHNRQNMGRRYVEVFRCKKLEYYRAIANEVSQGGYFESEYRRSSPPLRPPKKPAEDKGSMEYTEVLKLHGLPYSATTEDIIKFFLEYELTEENVHIAISSDGKATSEAFVEFPTAEVAKTAMCKDKMTIGTRYVELFPSTPEEASRARTRGKH
uniref:RRM domain-containing protein n=1 Tax=Zea mays TaxID=4577 RepID=A0A804UHY4_MAIZE